jgi:hypothetical protein
MDGHRQVDGRSQRTGPTAMNDAALDREVASLLAVEPSPEFLARVRTRVAQEPEPGGWRWRWTFALATVTVALIGAVVVWQSGQQAPSSEVPVRLPQVAEAVAPPAPVVVEVERPRASRPTRPTTRTREAANLIPLISADDARAFDTLLAAIRRNDVVLNADMPNSALSASTLALPPITIEPVTVPEPLEGGVE